MNILNALADRLERAVILRERCRMQAEEGPGAAFGLNPGIARLTRLIDDAKAAIGSGEAIDAVKAFAALEGVDVGG